MQSSREILPKTRKIIKNKPQNNTDDNTFNVLIYYFYYKYIHYVKQGREKK